MGEKMTMEVIELIEEMRGICETLRKEGKRIRLVPTMGALHIGHGSLIQSARENSSGDDNDLQHGEERQERDKEANTSGPLQANNVGRQPGHPSSSRSSAQTVRMVKNLSAKETVVVIVSIFVNPKQFDNPADYANYPNTRSADLEFCKRLNVRYAFTPRVEHLYPVSQCRRSSASSTATFVGGAPETNIQCMVAPPDRIANDLEGKSRQGHFKGMLTVVSKLFNIIRPHEAYFGEKDYQQLLLVAQMSRDLNQDVIIRPVPTVRDHDLLPFSSRNVRLSESQRRVAPVMYKILTDAKRALEDLDYAMCDSNNKYTKISSVLMASMLTTLCLNTDEHHAQMFHVDYLELRCAKDLSRIHYKQDWNLFDCELGCAEHESEKGHNPTTLKSRLLISVIVGKVRLLDNIEVLMNLNRVSE